MRHHALRLAFALFALALATGWSRPAWADATITGTVGEVGAGAFNGNAAVRFKFTDANQTATCTDQLGLGATLKYAFVTNADLGYREIYALVLVSKKGASMTCSVRGNTDCRVNYCTLN